MFYVYILQSESTGRFYTGSTADLDRRLAEHNSHAARATKNRGPWRIVHSESFPTRQQAMARERYFKTGHGRAELRKIVEAGARSSTGRGRLGDTLNQ